ncbi:hypothetical protein GmHk_15G044596 [Glycine max]|nr:hypothetical protein GmHk_15G044596 [Glycine max]KAH1210236.1 hypothetical protein GmHk_15G044596 [Glycine max]
MARTKKTGQMTYEAVKEIANKIDVLTVAIGRLEHPGRVRAAGAGITIKQYFGPAPRTSRMSSSVALEDLEQIQSQFQSQMQSQGLALPPEPEVGHSTAHVSTKESCVDSLGNNPDMSDLETYGLYIKENPLCLVTLGKLYEESTTVHNIPLRHDQVKVGVEEVRDADASIPVPNEEGVVGPTKPADRPDHDVNDPLYLMTLTIPQLFLKSLQVMWDATVFGVFNDNLPLYIKHEDLSEIVHNGQCLSIFVIQLWILHMTETSMRVGNVNVYGFLEPQSIQRSRQSQFESESYIKIWMQKSKRDVYLAAYLNSAHWQMVVILLKENIWFCSLHNRSDNYLKGIINSALKGLDNTPQSKSKVVARWIVVKYFNDARPLELERLKALRIQWTKYYLKVKNETISV